MNTDSPQQLPRLVKIAQRGDTPVGETSRGNYRPAVKIRVALNEVPSVARCKKRCKMSANEGENKALESLPILDTLPEKKVTSD